MNLLPSLTLSLFLSSACLVTAADSPVTVLRELQKDGVTYSYREEESPERTTWELRSAPGDELLLKLTGPGNSQPSGQPAFFSLYEYSNLMDVWREGDQAGILLSGAMGIFYFRVAKSAEGDWKPLWQQEIRGATGASANNRTIVLTGLSTVTFTRADDSASVFELTETSIKKDGKKYDPPGESVGVSFGSPVAVPVRGLSAEGARKISLVPRTGVYLEIEASGKAFFQWGSSPEDHFPFETDDTAIAALIEAVKADSQDTPASGSEGIQLYLYSTGDSPWSPGLIPPGKKLKAKVEEFLDLIRQSERGPRLKELLSTNSLYQG